MFSVDFLLRGVVAPAVAALIVVLLLKRGFTGSRGVGAIAYAVGQGIGTALLRDTDSWLPARNLQWVPWVGIGAALIGPMVVATGLTVLERWLLRAFVGTAAAVVLVPQWPDLWPSRPNSITLFVLSVSIVSAFTDGVTRRTSPRLVGLSFVGTSLLAAMLIAASLSLSVGEAALTTAGALGGTVAALLFRSDEMAIRGLCLPAILVIGGWCYVTAIEPPPPSPPLVALLFLPAAPLVLWLTAVGPIARWAPRPRWIASALLWLAYVAAIGTWTWFSTEHSHDEYSQHGPSRAMSIIPISHSSYSCDMKQRSVEIVSKVKSCQVSVVG